MFFNFLKKILFYLFVLGVSTSNNLYAQSLANYTSLRNTGVSYTSINLIGNAFDSWRYTGGFSQDDNRSDFTDIGFDFWYNGVRYTQFSVSTNGFLDFSSSTDDGGPTADDFGYDNNAFTANSAANRTNPAIAPFYDDLTAQGGVSALGNSIKYVLSGSAPSRTLTIEWINMAVYGNTSPSLNFQVKLIESTGLIVVNYSTMNSGTHTFSYSMGLNAQTMAAPPTAAQLKELQVVNSNTFNNTQTNNLSAMPTANSQYVFTPPVPTAAAGTVTFSAISQTGMTVNWPNWAANEVGYVLYNSIDNVNFNFVTQTAQNATNAVTTGLMPGTTYYWRVYAVTEGCLSAALTGTQATNSAGNKISISSGMWNTATTWSPTGVPTTADNVTVTAAHSVTVNADAVCNNLTVGQGSNAVLMIGNNNTARNIILNGSLVINTNATFNVNVASNTIHNITIPGNITNNGTLNFAPDAGSLCDVTFTKNGNQTISGTGATNRFNRMTLNMGTSINNILDIQTPSFVAPNDFITLTNGTFKLSTTGASNLTPYTTAATIPQKGGLWLNSPTSTISVLASLTMYGNVTVSNGLFNVGNAADEDLLSNGGFLTVSNGTLNIAGKYYAIGINNLSKFTIAGGIVNVPNIGSANTTIAPFQIAGAGSQFNMSGGSLVIPREGGTGAQNLGFVNTGASGGSVTGGTLQIGSTASPANQIILVNSSFPVGNLTVNSANVNATLLTNSLSVINNVTINSGSLTASGLGISLGKNWVNNGGTFVPGVGTVSLTGTTAQTIFKSGGETFNNISFLNAGTKTLLSAITASNVIINSGSNLDVNTTNNQITVRGNFTNDGTFNSQQGLVLFNGVLAQTIGGTGVINFYNWTNNNTVSSSITTGTVNLINTLTISNGTVNTNGRLTMVSTATNTARIAPIVGTGNIIGNVIVQRYAPGGSTGWALIGTPISSALTFQDWDDDIPISCATCPDGSAGGFVSIYSYNEAAVGNYSAAASYVPMTGITNPIIPNVGYWVYLGTGATSTSPITIDVTGTVRKFNNVIPLTRTNTGSPVDDGWNLIHNPYPSPISWTALRNGNASVDNAIYAYNADLNGGAGASAAYVNGVSSPAVGSGGIDNSIPMSQGFYVHCTAATNLTAQESNKIAGNPTFLKMSNTGAVTSVVPLLRLTLKKGNYKDETVVYLDGNTTDGFDTEYDAIKMAGQDPNAPMIRQMDGSKELHINGISLSTSNFTIPIMATTGYNGSYTISLQDYANFPQGACINIHDTQTGITTDLRAQNYVFNLTSSTTNARFILSITLNPLDITSNTSPASCLNPLGGIIIAKGNNAGPWNYSWKDGNGTVLKTSLNKVSADTLNNLSGGEYILDMSTVGQCDNNNSTYTIDNFEIPQAQFISVDTIDLTNGGNVTFTNTSLNAQNFEWNFGDNGALSSDFEPTYMYNSVGNYTIQLVAISSTGCQDTVYKTITVLNNMVGINELNDDKYFLIKTLPDNHFILDMKTHLNNNNVFVTDNLGRLILNLGAQEENEFSLSVDLSDVNSGVYYLNVNNSKENKVFKLLVK